MEITVFSKDPHNYLVSFLRSYFILPYICLYYPLDSRALRTETAELLPFTAWTPRQCQVGSSTQLGVYQRESCSEKQRLPFISCSCSHIHKCWNQRYKEFCTVQRTQVVKPGKPVYKSWLYSKEAT